MDSTELNRLIILIEKDIDKTLDQMLYAAKNKMTGLHAELSDYYRSLHKALHELKHVANLDAARKE